jgi:DeoR/GlpR family transcriptional regulator of sugar metabolism
VKRAICRQAAETLVLASREKLGAVSAYGVVGLGEVDGLVVGRKCPDELLTPFRGSGVEIISSTHD